MSSFQKNLQNLDAFRQVSRDLTRGSFSGGVFTAVAYGTLILLLLAEFGAFMRTRWRTNVVMDTNKETTMEIQFDILMYDLPCKYLKLGVMDKFGEEKISSKDKFHYIPVDHKGESKGMAYSKEEIALLEHADMESDLTKAETEELEAEWTSSSDHFKHKDFHSAVTHHEFTLVNFFAEWCVHCRQFHPSWNEMASRISGKQEFTLGDGSKTQVKMMKMNCVDFQSNCQEEKIAAFPTLRLYKKDGTFEQFKDKRTPENIEAFLQNTIRNSNMMVAKHHHMFDTGCQVQGTLQVPRVPGHFYLQAEAHGNVNVNPALTNVSHKINHLSFGKKDIRKWIKKQKIPDWVLKHINPLDGKSFSVDRFHDAPHHYLKVVSGYLQGKTKAFYQMTHTDRVKRATKEQMSPSSNQAPQAVFSYDISPMSIIVKAKNKRWYEFLTSLFAILGGTYTIVELTSGAVDTVGSAVKEALGKSN
eukprot:TRINITY_DN18434_c0_g1_i1.p1 TRINITY_DN18434_c0_g1~~TRINITY_DN18434_c0_g1_i1.p1  ORF type:complete len:473 (-),score=73.55 TRINITY_DN18434_c0_g1_i1:96-1514(-)